MMCCFSTSGWLFQHTSPGCNGRRARSAFPRSFLIALVPRFRNRDKARRAGLERTAATQGIGLVRDPAAMDRLTMHAVALVVVHLARSAR